MEKVLRWVPPRMIKPRSAVGIKADAIRIVGREGIKLITKTDDTEFSRRRGAG